MNLRAVHIPHPRLINRRRRARFERLADHDRFSTPSDLVMRPFFQVPGLYR